MTIPLDRLYHFIEDVAKESYGDSVLIYRFWPHGAKNLQNLTPLNNDIENYPLRPAIYCNDQEPLFYDYYEQQVQNLPQTAFSLARKKIDGNRSKFHFNFRNQFDSNEFCMLLHSELRSKEVDKYAKHQFIPVYYWSHAVIAMDWFRYAQHIKQNKNIKHLFKIYNRAWAGTREYRLKFIELLINKDLKKYCQANLNTCDPEINIHYDSYTFKNCIWKPTHNIENFFPPTSVSSELSAEFVLDDYNHSNIEVVLETLFDDSRLHLTEKTLRPIALGQPFILASTHGSLQYLKKYGFQTYDSVWNEEYDLIEDPMSRLVSIVNLMKEISTWSGTKFQQKMLQANEIAEYNKRHFFSQNFSNLIFAELKQNFQTAFDWYKQHNTNDRWINRWEKLSRDQEIQEIFANGFDHAGYGLEDIMNFVNKLKTNT